MTKGEMLRLGIILSLITLGVALMLSLANIATAGRIEQLKIQAENEAKKSVLSSADEFEVIDMDFKEYEVVSKAFEGLSNGNKVGYCVSVAPVGFGGPIEMIVGIGSDGNVTGIKIINDLETPGLGSKAKDEAFKGQYDGKSAGSELEVIKNGAPKDNQIVAISGATITSDAVTAGVNTAIKVYNEKLK